MSNYKNCDGKKINKCRNCGNTYHFLFVDWCTAKAPDNPSRKIKDMSTIPKWCPLSDWKEATNE